MGDIGMEGMGFAFERDMDLGWGQREDHGRQNEPLKVLRPSPWQLRICQMSVLHGNRES